MPPAMTKPFFLVAALVLLAIGAPGAQVSRFTPITNKMLLNPSPDDWLMYSRTYDAQRFSPLKQITRQNVGQLKEVLDARAGRTGNWRASRSSIAASCTWCCRERRCGRSTPPPAR